MLKTSSTGSNGTGTPSLEMFHLWAEMNELKMSRALTDQAVDRIKDDIDQLKDGQKDMQASLAETSDRLSAETREVAKRIERGVIFFALAVGGVLWQIVSGKLGI